MSENELTRVSRHMQAERERAPQRDRVREHLRRQIVRAGSVDVTQALLEEAFAWPDITENFFLAASGCRPIATIREQIDDWCKANEFRLLEKPHPYESLFTIVDLSRFVRVVDEKTGESEIMRREEYKRRFTNIQIARMDSKTGLASVDTLKVELQQPRSEPIGLPYYLEDSHKCQHCGVSLSKHSKPPDGKTCYYVVPGVTEDMIIRAPTWTCDNHAPGLEVKDIPRGEACSACGRRQPG